ncbi:MAG: hypothetical protein WC554_14540 [Clostridia bacterium]
MALTHKDLIDQTAKIIKNYINCTLDYKSKDDITITIGEIVTHFDDEKRAGDYILGYAGGIVTGMHFIIQKEKKESRMFKLFGL